LPGIITRGKDTIQAASERPVAVIDIGSNSIRLVVYDSLSRVSFPVFNEKIECGLGRDLDRTGCLHPDGVNMARQSLHRFVALLNAMGVAQVVAVATAAIRDAKDGPAFAKELEAFCDFPIQILSGKEEARISANGVLSAIPNAAGFVGDLGGGSVELVAIEGGRIKELSTLPLGPIRMAREIVIDADAALQVVNRNIEGLDWIGDGEGKAFYAVGGAWRAFASAHMAHIGYPLNVSHHYEIATPDAIKFARHIESLSPEDIAALPGPSRKRSETLAYASVLLERLLTISKVDKVVFSAYGLREGCLYEQQPEPSQEEDPLIEICHRVSTLTGRLTADGEALFHWISPAFKEDEAWQIRLRRAACLLADLEWSEHPDYRVEHALLRILRYPLVGVDHAGRAFMALAVASRHAKVRSQLMTRFVEPLLSPPEMDRARATGLAMRLGYTFSGGVVSLLEQTSLSRDGDRLTLCMPDHADVLVGDVVQRRLKSLAQALGCTPDVTYVASFDEESNPPKSILARSNLVG
jgi:exopolyphosphatase / guanosine-5'-triphosphate,3'-diphosphate pyrophosphatase